MQLDEAGVRQKVVDIVAEQLDVSKDQIKDETNFVDDLGADSLDIAELVMEFEDAFDLNIPENEQGIRTIGDAIKYILDHAGEKSKAASS